MAAMLPPTSPLDIARCNIDSQLHAIEIKHRSLREKRNSLSYICRLPRELLCAIFQIYIDDTRRYHTGTPVSQWYTFTHVCTTWRRTAVHNPGLWNHITFNQPLWVQEMLRRSRTLPLTVELTPSTNTNTSFNTVDYTLQQCYRISDLRLSTSKYASLSHLAKQLNGPFLVMRSLTISITFQDIPIITLPDIFSNNNFPVLERLSLSGCGFNWEGVLPSSLVSLSVAYDNSLSQSNSPQLQHVLNVLQSTPHLSSLTLLWSLPDDDDEVSTPDYIQDSMHPLELNKLTDLRIVDKAPALAAFLAVIRIPHHARVHLGCQTSSGAAIVKLGVALSQCGLVTQARPIASLIVDQVSYEHVHFVARCFDESRSDIRIDVTWAHWGEVNGESAISDLCRVFDLSGLTVLYVVDVGLVDYKVWLSTFSSALRLSTLCVRGEPTHGLLRALQHHPVDSTNPQFLPSLRTMILEQVQFQRDETKLLLFEFLTRRRDLNIGLREVTIHASSGFGPHDFAMVEKLVPDSVWDQEILANTISSEIEVEVTPDDVSDGYGSEYSSLEDYDYQD